MQIIPDRLDQIADQGIREHAAGYGDVIDAAPEYQLVLVRRKRPQRGLWRYSPLVHLVGRDDGHLFAHRLPATVATVTKALAYMMPKPVADAIARGWPVQRQGDIWAAGQPREGARADYIGLHIINGTRHRVIDDGKPWAVLRHDAGQHPDVILWAGYRWRLYRARSVGGAGD